MLRIATALVTVLFLTGTPCLAQNDWQQVAYDSGVGVAFYYSPGSVQHEGDLATAKWHDSRHPELVFLAQVSCSARTIRNLSVDEFDANGTLTQTMDLSSQSALAPVGPPGTFGANLLQAIC
jgi:hypothetical protein